MKEKGEVPDWKPLQLLRRRLLSKGFESADYLWSGALLLQIDEQHRYVLTIVEQMRIAFLPVEDYPLEAVDERRTAAERRALQCLLECV